MADARVAHFMYKSSYNMFVVLQKVMVVVQEPYQNEIQGMFSSYQVCITILKLLRVVVPLLETSERLER